jgi:SAM-dependent methyltransferase
MQTGMLTTEEAILQLRRDPKWAGLIRDSYLEPNVFESAERFLSSAEFLEVQRLIGTCLLQGRVLDLGAGNGIASWAFAESGAKLVYALEPDPSNEIGSGAIRRLTAELPVRLIDAYGEEIPLPEEEVDLVYTRQVLHHTSDLQRVLQECARVLRCGGTFFACREHVVDNEQQLQAFLSSHPVHLLTGAENAYRLDEYLEAIRLAGLKLEKVLGPWDTVINAFPAVRTTEELERYPQIVLERRFGRIGTLASLAPGVNSLVWRGLKRPSPGRLYSFLATKP